MSSTPTVQTDGFDDLREQADAPKAESWKPEKPGDEIAGIVAKLDAGFDRDGNEHGIVVLKTETGLRSVWLLTEALRNQMLKADPQPGDRLLIQYKGKATAKASGRSYHDFAVTTDRTVSTWWDRRRSAKPAVIPAGGDEEFFPPEPNPFDDEPPY